MDFNILYRDFCAVANINIFISEIFWPSSFDITSSNITSFDSKNLSVEFLELILLELKSDIDFLNFVDNFTHLFQYIVLINLGNKFDWNWLDDGHKHDEFITQFFLLDSKFLFFVLVPEGLIVSKDQAFDRHRLTWLHA